MKKVIYNRPLTLTEARRLAKSESGRLFLEDVVNLKKNPRSVKDAKSGAYSAAVKGFNPYAPLYDGWKAGKDAAKKAIRLEMKKMKKEDDKITFSTNFLKGGVFYAPEDGILEFGIHIYMEAKKNWLSRLFTGSLFSGWGDLGVIAMRALIKEFAGDIFAKQVTKKTIFNAVGQNENEGKTSYFFCLKLRQPKKD